MLSTIDIQEVNEISIKAGKAIMEVYDHSDFSNSIDYKSDNSPLTIADKIAHEIINSSLIEKFPHIPIISEEGRQTPYEERSSWEYFWLVDPLDGTKEFIKRNGEFTVNIALVHHRKPVLGSIYIPSKDILYYGSSGPGAFKSVNGIPEKIKVSNKERSLTIVGSRSHSTEQEKLFLEKLDISHQITAGSSIKFCMVADGQADVYYREGPTMEWDTAAGQAIVESAGGSMVDIFRKTFEYNKPILLNTGFICNGSFLKL